MTVECSADMGWEMDEREVYYVIYNFLCIKVYFQLDHFGWGCWSVCVWQIYTEGQSPKVVN